MLSKVKHKTRLTQNKKAKHTSNANSKKKKKERERGGEGEGERERKVTKSLRSFFLPHLGGIFPFNKTLIQQ